MTAAETGVDGAADEETAEDDADEDGDQGEAGVGGGPASFDHKGHGVGEEEVVHETWGDCLVIAFREGGEGVVRTHRK